MLFASSLLCPGLALTLEHRLCTSDTRLRRPWTGSRRPCLRRLPPHKLHRHPRRLDSLTPLAPKRQTVHLNLGFSRGICLDIPAFFAQAAASGISLLRVASCHACISPRLMSGSPRRWKYSNLACIVGVVAMLWLSTSSLNCGQPHSAQGHSAKIVFASAAPGRGYFPDYNAAQSYVPGGHSQRPAGVVTARVKRLHSLPLNSKERAQIAQFKDANIQAFVKQARILWEEVSNRTDGASRWLDRLPQVHVELIKAYKQMKNARENFAAARAAGIVDASPEAAANGPAGGGPESQTVRRKRRRSRFVSGLNRLLGRRKDADDNAVEGGDATIRTATESSSIANSGSSRGESNMSESSMDVVALRAQLQSDMEVLKNFVGVGGFGMVFRYPTKSNPNLLVKVLKRTKVDALSTFIDVFSAQYMFSIPQHPSLMKWGLPSPPAMIDRATGDIYMMLEEAKGLNFTRIVYKRLKPYHRLIMGYQVFPQLKSALDHMHKWGISHNDIKLDNIILTERRTSNPTREQRMLDEIHQSEFHGTLIDFGLSTLSVTSDRWMGTGHLEDAPELTHLRDYMDTVVRYRKLKRAGRYTLMLEELRIKMDRLEREGVTWRPRLVDLFQMGMVFKFMLGRGMLRRPDFQTCSNLLDRATSKNPTDRIGALDEFLLHFKVYVDHSRAQHKAAVMQRYNG
eukprot:GHVT01019977.1.p1 GENE.GHVT01019977.1~~GHVT01019977.1.p1  ORF type:complete len:684 (+),score=39.13 GHVT01019977.1:259-2310(+)